MAETQARLLTVLSLLQTRRDWTGEQLAARLDVSARTVRRDVERLRALGYRIHATKGPDGGYRLEAGSELPPLLFDDEQAVAIAIALRTAATQGAGIEEAAERALTTVRQVMPSRLRHRVDAVQVTPIPRAGAVALDVDVLLVVSAATRSREVLRFDYDRVPDGRGQDEAAPGGVAPEPPHPARRAEPHHVVTHAGRWYLVAWDLDRAAWRTYRIDRIHPRTPNGPRFAPREVPGGDVRAFVAARFRGVDDPDGTTAQDAWPCVGEAVLALPAHRVAPFADDGTVEDLGGGRTRLRLGAWSWNALAATLGRFDAPIEMVGPDALRAAFGDLARRFAEASGSSEDIDARSDA